MPLLVLSAATSSAQINVLTSDYGVERTGANLQEAQLSVSNVVPGSFGLLGAFPVDGQIFGQPLYFSGLTLPGQGQHNVLYVTTEHNSVYAFDADAVDPPLLLWHVSLGEPVPSSILSSDTGAYTDVSPEIGILSTGVIDPDGGVLYVVAEVLQKGAPVFQLHALDLGTGEERMSGPVNVAATLPGSGAGAVGDGTLPFDPTQHIQRPGLLLSNGAVYVAFGSHGDAGMWHGWLMSYDASNLAHQFGAFETTPSGQGGAIWQSGRGLAADDTGSVYFVTGNGDYDGQQNYGESFVKVTGAAPVVADWYTPADWQALSSNDYDLSGGPAVVPGTHWLVGGDKNGDLYLVNGDSMGHLDAGGAAQIFQAVSGWIFSMALWSRPDATYVYVRDGDGSIKCFALGSSGFVTSPVSASGPTTGGARVGMAVSANGGQDGTGILWITTGSYSDPSVPGILHAFDASNLASEIWNSAMNPGDSLNGFAKFASPTIANGKVYAASTNLVSVYGLLAGDGSQASPGGTPRPRPIRGRH